MSRVGRFSTGMQQRPTAVRTRRIGRFSTGLARLAAPAVRRIGRFSTGVERVPADPDARRRGSFADSDTGPR
jgi:hypothetical protein